MFATIVFVQVGNSGRRCRLFAAVFVSCRSFVLSCCCCSNCRLGLPGERSVIVSVLYVMFQCLWAELGRQKKEKIDQGLRP